MTHKKELWAYGTSTRIYESAGPSEEIPSAAIKAISNVNGGRGEKDQKAIWKGVKK